MQTIADTNGTQHRLDPEPLSILAAITGVVGTGISAVNYWRSHHKPLPNWTRARLVSRLDKLAAEVRYLSSDVESSETTFKRATFPGDRSLRLGNGALVTIDEFRRYEQLADRVFGRLKRVHKLALQVQGLAFELPFVDKGLQANATGEALSRADALLRSRNYSVDEAWRELRGLIADLESMIGQLNADLPNTAMTHRSTAPARRYRSALTG
jgi:hypothetical protein